MRYRVKLRSIETSECWVDIEAVDARLAEECAQEILVAEDEWDRVDCTREVADVEAVLESDE